MKLVVNFKEEDISFMGTHRARDSMGAMATAAPTNFQKE